MLIGFHGVPRLYGLDALMDLDERAQGAGVALVLPDAAARYRDWDLGCDYCTSASRRSCSSGTATSAATARRSRPSSSTGPTTGDINAIALILELVQTGHPWARRDQEVRPRLGAGAPAPERLCAPRAGQNLYALTLQIATGEADRTVAAAPTAGAAPSGS